MYFERSSKRLDLYSAQSFSAKNLKTMFSFSAQFYSNLIVTITSQLCNFVIQQFYCFVRCFVEQNFPSCSCTRVQEPQGADCTIWRNSGGNVFKNYFSPPASVTGIAILLNRLRVKQSSGMHLTHFPAIFKLCCSKQVQKDEHSTETSGKVSNFVLWNCREKQKVVLCSGLQVSGKSCNGNYCNLGYCRQL